MGTIPTSMPSAKKSPTLAYFTELHNQCFWSPRLDWEAVLLFLESSPSGQAPLVKRWQQ